jgi:hypothetical protein
MKSKFIWKRYSGVSNVYYIYNVEHLSRRYVEWWIVTGMIQHICKLMTYGSFSPMKFNITTNFPFETPLYLFQMNLLFIFFAYIYTCIYVLLTFFTFSSLLLFLPFYFVCGCCGVCFSKSFKEVSRNSILFLILRILILNNEIHLSVWLFSKINCDNSCGPGLD